MHNSWSDGQSKERASPNKPSLGKEGSHKMEAWGEWWVGGAGPHKFDLTDIHLIFRNLLPISIPPP